MAKNRFGFCGWLNSEVIYQYVYSIVNRVAFETYESSLRGFCDACFSVDLKVVFSMPCISHSRSLDIITFAILEAELIRIVGGMNSYRYPRPRMQDEFSQTVW